MYYGRAREDERRLPHLFLLEYCSMGQYRSQETVDIEGQQETDTWMVKSAL